MRNYHHIAHRLLHGSNPWTAELHVLVTHMHKQKVSFQAFWQEPSPSYPPVSEALFPRCPAILGLTPRPVSPLAVRKLPGACVCQISPSLRTSFGSTST